MLMNRWIFRSTINSPKILELSGIGDATVLRNAGVEVKLDLPGVGNNMQDHWYIGLSYGASFIRYGMGFFFSEGASHWLRSEINEASSERIRTFDQLRDPAFAAKQMAL